MRKSLYAAIVVSTALALRLYPTLLSRMPFSTDAWPLIRNVDALLNNTPIELGDEGVFDGYNNFWPANMLFGAAFSLVTGLEPLAAMALAIPLTGAFTVLVLFTLVDKVMGRAEYALAASAIFATAFPHSLFTAGVTKETYANPLYVLSILLFLTGRRWPGAILFALASLALVMAHHLTTFITIAVLGEITLAITILRVRDGLGVDGFKLLNLSLLTTITASYFLLYASKGLKVAPTPSDLLSAASHQILAFSLAMYFITNRRYSRMRSILECSGPATFALLLAILSTQREVVGGLPTLPSHYLLYEAPLILVSLLAGLGFGALRLNGEHGITPLFWLFWFSAVVGMGSYATFGNPPVGGTLAYRTLNFLYPPLLVFSAAGLHRLYEAIKRMRGKGGAALAAAALLAPILALNSYDLYAAVSLQERYMGYFWLYRQQEFQAAAWLSDSISGQVVAGDVKVSYLLKGYFDVETDPLKGMLYLTGKSGSEPDVMFLYSEVARKGYVLYGGYSIDLPGDWVGRVSKLNLLYSNGLVKILGR